MIGMITEYLVEIRVPLQNGKTWFGSGYTLAPHWVLTACHVVFPDKPRDTEKPITITWWDETEKKTKGEMEIHIDAIRWFNHEHDIALIECNAPYPSLQNAWALINPEYPTAQAGFKSGGYLSGLKNSHGKQRRKTPSGNLGDFSSQATQVDLGQLSVSLDDDSLWAGFSGSPVFVNDRIAAIVTQTNRGERGGGLVAALISPALEAIGAPDDIALKHVDGFMVPPADSVWFEQLHPYVIELLAMDGNTFQLIKNEFLQKVVVKSDIINAEALADALHKAPVDKVVSCFLASLRKLKEQRSMIGADVLEQLAGVWVVLLAVEREVLFDIPSYKQNPASEPLKVPAAAPEKIEVEGLAAKNEGRKAKLRRRGGNLKSDFDMTPEAPTGLDEDDYFFATDAMTQVGRKTRPGLSGFIDEAHEQLEKFATREGTGLERPLSDDADERREIISDQLGLDYDELGGSVYIRIPPLDRVSSDSALHKLHEWYPPLLVFEVTTVKDRERTRSLSALNRIIHGAQEFLSDRNNQ